MGKIRSPFYGEKFTGFFDNYKFFINPETNELEIKYICNECKTIMTHDQMLKGNYSLKCAYNGPLQYHTAKFWCESCASKIRQQESEAHE